MCLTLKGGQRVEAYFLNVYGDRLVYYVKETDRSWLREETLRSEVETIDFQQYLDKDPVAPRKVERARKQPARKLDLLSGVFRGQIGRDTYWTLSFQSELDKYLEFSEDATDYGTIEIETSYLQRVEEGLPPSLLPRAARKAARRNTTAGRGLDSRGRTRSTPWVSTTSSPPEASRTMTGY
jgi:hypothetical protein